MDIIKVPAPRKSDPCVYRDKAEGFTIWCKKFSWFTKILKFKVFLNLEREAIKLKRWPITATFSSVYFKEHCKGVFNFRDGQQIHFGNIFQWKKVFSEVRVFLCSVRRTKVIHPNTLKNTCNFSIHTEHEIMGEPFKQLTGSLQQCPDLCSNV